MNNLIKEFAHKSGFRYGDGSWIFAEDSDLAEFADLIISEHTKVLKQEWYRLNNLPPVPDESARDVGLRVGKKIQTVLLIHHLRKHFNE